MAEDVTQTMLDDATAPKPADVVKEEAPAGIKALRALRHRNFRLFFGGQMISLVGTWMQSVAQAWLVLKLTNSPFMLGVVSFANYLPILFVALFAGVVVDHVDRRRMLILSQTLLMSSAFVLSALTFTGVVRVEYVIMLASFNGFVSSFDMPGRQAFVVDMVGPEDLPNAIALNSVMVNISRTAGPAIAGLLIALVGTAGCFFLNGVSYLAVIWSLWQMHIARRDVQTAGTAIFQRLREGLNYVWGHRPSFYLLLMVVITSGFGMQFTVLVPVFARDILKAGASGYGFLMAAQGIGAVIGAATLASRAGAPRALRQNLTVGLFCAATAIIIFGTSTSMPLSMAAQVLIGGGLINFMASANTLLQLFVSDELRGRVMSMYTLSFIGTSPIGALSVGFVGQHLTPEIAVVMCGVISLCGGVFLLTRLGLIARAQAEAVPRRQSV